MVSQTPPSAFLLDIEPDGIPDELRMFLNDLFQLLLLKVFDLIFLHGEDNIGLRPMDAPGYSQMVKDPPALNFQMYC